MKTAPRHHLNFMVLLRPNISQKTSIESVQRSLDVYLFVSAKLTRLTAENDSYFHSRDSRTETRDDLVP